MRYLLIVIILFLSVPVYAQEDLLTLGMKAYTNGQFTEAEEALETAYDKVADDFRITYWLGSTYKAQGQYTRAKSFYLKTLNLYPSFPATIYVDLADASLANKDYEESLHYIDIAHKKGMNSAYLRQMEGVAMLNLKKHKQALQAFQDVVATKGELAKEASLYTGFTQQAMKNLKAAEVSFQNVLEIGREDDLSVLARRQMGLQQTTNLQDQKPFTLRVGLSYQTDSNPTVKPNDATLVALANIAGERDESKVVRLDLGWRPITKGQLGISGNYNLYADFHEKFSAQNVMSHTITATPFYRFSTHSISVPVSANYTRVDNRNYLRHYSISPSVSIPIGNRFLWQLSARGEFYNYATRANAPEEERNNDTYGGGAGFYWFLKGQEGFLNLRADVSTTDADGANWDRNTYRFSSYLIYPLIDNLTGSVSASYTKKDFDNVHSTAFVSRDDHTYSGTVGLSYEIYDGIEISLTNTYQRNKSKVILYDYDRNITNLGIQKSWKF